MGDITERRYEGLTVWVGPDHVMRAKGCSYSTACELLRACLGRQPGERGLLRAPLQVWEQFAMRQAHLTTSTRTRVTPRPTLADLKPRSAPALEQPDVGRKQRGPADEGAIKETMPRTRKP